MTNFEILILVWTSILTLQVIQNMNRIGKMGWDMTRKMDKPAEPTEWDKWVEARKDKPLLSEKELREAKIRSGEEVA